MLRNNIMIKFFAFCVLGFMGNVAAENTLSVSPQDIDVSAKTFQFDNTNGIAIYEGSVFAKQGDREIIGDRLEIYRDAHTGEISKLVVFGKLAEYHGRTKKEEPMLIATAQKITYLPQKEYFILEERAKLTQNGDSFHAPHIEYDMKKQKMYSPVSNKGNTSIILKKSDNNGNPL